MTANDENDDALENKSTDRASYLRDLHIKFIIQQQETRGTMEYYMVEHMLLEAMYWSLTCLDLLHALDHVDTDKVVKEIETFYNAELGAYGNNKGLDPHLIPTLNAVQIFALLDRLDELDSDAITAYIAGLQNEDGSFKGDKWGEVDSRFAYSAVNALSLLGRLDAIDCTKAADWIARCRNFDGGYGTHPGAESHSGQVFCCVGALAILGCPERIDVDTLGWWLAERQTEAGGLNGRPEKLQDVCYSWWVLSGMAVMKRVHWIDSKRLRTFILSCQDDEDGGISDRPGDCPDVYHTFFGTCGLSLMGDKSFKEVDPLYALPRYVTERVAKRNATRAADTEAQQECPTPDKTEPTKETI